MVGVNSEINLPQVPKKSEPAKVLSTSQPVSPAKGRIKEHQQL